MTGLLKLSGERHAYVFNSETVQFHNHTITIQQCFNQHVI